MNTKVRINFPVLELFTSTVIVCAALIVLYPGGDRIAITWLTGRSPVTESYFVSDTHPKSYVTQANPSAIELLRRERSKSSIKQNNEQLTLMSDRLAPTQSGETTPTLKGSTPIDSDPFASSDNEFQTSRTNVPARQIGFPRMPERIDNDLNKIQFRNLPPLNESAGELSIPGGESRFENQAGPEQRSDEGRAQRTPAASHNVGNAIRQITKQELDSFSPVKEGSITWNSVVSQEMVVQPVNVQPTAKALDEPQPVAEEKLQVVETDSYTNARQTKNSVPQDAATGRGAQQKTGTLSLKLPPMGGDFVPGSLPVNRLKQSVPTQQHQQPESYRRKTVGGANLLDQFPGNPLR